MSHHDDALQRQLDRERRERRRLARSLLECEERYQNFAAHAKAGICIIQDTALRYVNTRMADILGYTPDDLLGRSFIDLAHPDALQQVEDSYERFNTAGDLIQQFESAVVHRSGQRIDVEINLSMTHYDGQRAGLVLLYDITERKRAEAQIHLLTQQLIKAQESERARIAMELHDKVAQDLSSLKIAMETLFDDRPDVSSDLSGRVSALGERLQEAIGAVRDIAYNLRPPGLDKLGLVRTVHLACEDYQQRTGIGVDFYTAGMEDINLGVDTRIHLYRLIQEALRNIERHANATRITIRLVASSPNVVLRIIDDGSGFDVAHRLMTAHAEKRMGLRSMQERVRLIGGTMDIQSRPRRGTRIFIEVPGKEKTSGG